MGKKRGGGKNSGLGRTILKERSRRKTKGQSWLHTSDIGDGYDWGRLNLRSVTEESRLDDFLHTAELAGTEFTAEKLNIRVVDPAFQTGLPSSEERGEIERAQKENRQHLAIPRRPPWDSSMSAEQLDLCERESFLEWRRGLAQLEEGNERLVITPFEKNLQFWRQLWRVVERSDVVVQIVDGRNPLLFRCEDLEKYVKEGDSHKVNMLLVNKADLLTQAQREAWAEYFAKSGDITVAFWSATAESGSTGAEDPQEEEEEEEEEEETEEEGEEEGEQEEEGDEEGEEKEGADGEENGEKAGHHVGLIQDSQHEISENLHVQDCSVDQVGCEEKRVFHVDSTNHGKSSGGQPSHKLECKDGLASDSQLNTTSSSPPAQTSDLAAKNDREITTENLTGERINTSERDLAENRTDERATIERLNGERDVTAENLSDVEGEINLCSGMPSGSSPGPIVAQPPQADDGTRSPELSSDINRGVESTRVLPGASIQVQPSPTSARAKLLSREELIKLFLDISPVKDGELTTVGLVGYPNVGKSSTINTLFQDKKVPVSATPGRTKHFQTLYISDSLMLCDCPGLVFPTFVTTKAELVCSGILPIDQMRDHIPPTSLVCQNIPRATLEQIYHLRLPRPREGEDPTRPPTAHELLSTYGYMRGFMTHHGLPDCPRSARYILKDYVSGKLLYCHPPPGVDPNSFNLTAAQDPLTTEVEDSLATEAADEGSQQRRTEKPAAAPMSEFDQYYFKQDNVRALTRGIHGARGIVQGATLQQADSEEIGVLDSDTASIMSEGVSRGKPWKKHYNQHKREKTKRLVKAYH